MTPRAEPVITLGRSATTHEVRDGCVEVILADGSTWGTKQDVWSYDDWKMVAGIGPVNFGEVRHGRERWVQLTPPNRAWCVVVVPIELSDRPRRFGAKTSRRQEAQARADEEWARLERKAAESIARIVFAYKGVRPQ